jgi:hypothetical protein
VDAFKVRASLTLFQAAAHANGDAEVLARCAECVAHFNSDRLAYSGIVLVGKDQQMLEVLRREHSSVRKLHTIPPQVQAVRGVPTDAEARGDKEPRMGNSGSINTTQTDRPPDEIFQVFSRRRQRGQHSSV